MKTLFLLTAASLESLNALRACACHANITCVGIRRPRQT